MTRKQLETSLSKWAKQHGLELVAIDGGPRLRHNVYYDGYDAMFVAKAAKP